MVYLWIAKATATHLCNEKHLFHHQMTGFGSSLPSKLAVSGSQILKKTFASLLLAPPDGLESSLIEEFRNISYGFIASEMNNLLIILLELQALVCD